MRIGSRETLNDTVTEVMFYLCMALTILLIATVIIMDRLHITFLDIFTRPCIIWEHTGIYCPGCGFTRAMTYLVGGHLLKSFLTHPAVIIGALMDLVFIGSQLTERVTKGMIRGLEFRLGYVYILLGIIIIQCLLKNFGLLIL